MRLLALRLAVLGLLLVPDGASGKTQVKSGIPAKVRAVLLERALSQAAEYGDRHPSDIQAVRTTTCEVVGPCGENLTGGRPIYLVAMRGRFPLPHPCAPPSMCDPMPVLTMEIILSTLQSYTVGVGPEYPDLEKLGAPVHGIPVRLEMSKPS